ncbi:hypothetical protein Y032_0042g551 [Ancylostoma ceylanicum]|nr:hypothetical protein Y032_0042g551 [Ancylostoma ceylanicum]
MSRILVLIVFIIAGVNSLFHDHTVMALDCPVNESYHICGPACEPSCARPKPQLCTEECILPGCRCEPGFFRNSVGICVADCSNEPCGEGMERRSCGVMEGCEPVCLRRTRKVLRCENKCVKNACQCKPGYIREFTAGMCIPMEECNVRRGKALEDAMVPISNGIAQ